MSRSVSKRAKNFWDRLGAWYGSRLAEQYGTHPPEDWCILFDRNDDERMEVALISVRQLSPGHPPTLGQIEAALPARRDTSTKRSDSEKLCAYAIETLGASLCRHQLARTWNYFGPVKEFLSKNRDNETILHVEVRGAQIPACSECGTPSHRVFLENSTTGVPASSHDRWSPAQ